MMMNILMLCDEKRKDAAWWHSASIPVRLKPSVSPFGVSVFPWPIQSENIPVAAGKLAKQASSNQGSRKLDKLIFYLLFMNDKQISMMSSFK